MFLWGAVSRFEFEGGCMFTGFVFLMTLLLCTRLPVASKFVFTGRHIGTRIRTYVDRGDKVAEMTVGTF